MKRKDFIKIIKLRSVWKIDKRLSNVDYTLPSGEKLSDYIEELVTSQMEIDSLLIRENGDLCLGERIGNECKLFPAYLNNEFCHINEMGKRINNLIYDVLYG